MGEEGLAQMLLNGARLFNGLVKSSGDNLTNFLSKRRGDEYNSLTPLQKNVLINQRAAQNEQNANNVGITNQDLIDYMNSEAVKAKYAQMQQELNQRKALANAQSMQNMQNEAAQEYNQMLLSSLKWKDIKCGIV